MNQIRLKYIIDWDITTNKFKKNSCILFWDIIPYANNTPPQILQISDDSQFKSFNTVSNVGSRDNGLHYSYEIDYSNWIDTTKFFRIVIGNDVSNVVSITFKEKYEVDALKMLKMLSGHRFYTSSLDSNLGAFYKVYANELNEIWYNVCLYGNYFLFLNYLIGIDFNVFDKLNEFDKVALKIVLSEIKRLGNIRSSFIKLFNALTGNDPILTFVNQKSNIIIGDENNYYYIIDQGIPSTQENPPLRSWNNLIWGLEIQYTDPLDVLLGKEDIVKDLINNFISCGYDLKLEKKV